jgi:hypothetical protein
MNKTIIKILIGIILLSPFNISSENIKINFYGKQLSFTEPLNLPVLDEDLNEKSIKTFCKKFESNGFDNLYHEILSEIKTLKLNDYGYYSLTSSIVSSLYPNDNNSCYIFITLMMDKHNIKTVIGYSRTKTYCLLATNRDIYERNYYQIERDLYYVFYNEKLRKNIPLLFYRFDNKKAIPMNLDIIDAPKIPYDKKERKYHFEFQEKKYAGTLLYNMNLVNYYNDYPKVIIKTKFDSPMDSISKASIIDNFKSIVDNMGEVESINFLLHFMHQYFEYKIDARSFREERNLFSEEFLHYKYSDCEDRAIFFAYLVNNLTDLDIIGIEYDDHISTAIAFNEALKGDYYKLNNTKYYSADPTYINSVVGQIMKGYKKKKAKLIKLDIH